MSVTLIGNCVRVKPEKNDEYCKATQKEDQISAAIEAHSRVCHRKSPLKETNLGVPRALRRPLKRGKKIFRVHPLNILCRLKNRGVSCCTLKVRPKFWIYTPERDDEHHRTFTYGSPHPDTHRERTVPVRIQGWRKGVGRGGENVLYATRDECYGIFSVFESLQLLILRWALISFNSKNLVKFSIRKS